MFMNEYTLNFDYRYNRDIEVVKNQPLISKHKKYSKLSKNKIDEQYWQLIMEMLQVASIFSPKDKKDFVEVITEDYEVATGLQMNSQMLLALADFLLEEVLTDNSAHKVKYDDYAILSFRQIKRRSVKECAYGEDIVEMADIKSRREYVKKRRTMEFDDIKNK